MILRFGKLKKWPIKHGKRKSALARLIIPLVILLIFASLLVFYLMIVYKPNGYNPIQISKLQQRHFEELSLKKAEHFHNSVYQGKRFSMSFDHKLLNNMLLDSEIDKYLVDRVGEKVHKFRWPQVYIDSCGIRLMGQVTNKYITAVLTIGFKLEITEDGLLKITRLPIKIGAITLPESLVQGRLEQMAKKLRAKLINHNSIDNKDLSKDLLKILSLDLPNFLENGYITGEPVLDIDHDTLAKIVGIEIRQGAIDLEFVPMHKDN